MGRLSGRVGLSTEKIVSLKKMRIPAIVVSVLLILIDHINGGLRVFLSFFITSNLRLISLSM
jgi:hypothetical protein